MINNLLEDSRCGFAFSNFRTKPRVLKRKLGAEFVEKEWNVTSAGFGGDLSLKFQKNHNRKVSKYKIKTLPQKILTTDSKSIPKPTRTEFIPPDSTATKVQCNSPRNLKISPFEENESKSSACVSSKRPGSVFLEVQNIQSSFQKLNQDLKLKPIVELPTQFSKKFKAEILCDDPRQTNKPDIALTNCALAQIKPYCKSSFELLRKPKVKRIKNKYIESRNIQSVRNKVNYCNSSVKAVSNFQIKTDLALEHVDDIPSSFPNDKTIEVTDFSKKAVVNDSSFFPIKSDLISKQGDKVQNIHYIEGNKSSNVSEFSKKLFTKAELHFQFETDPKAKQDVIQNESNSATDNKSPKIAKFDEKSKIELSAKKKSGEQNAFQNSFLNNKSDIKPLSPKFAQNFKSNLLPRGDGEPGHVPKKLKVDKFTFIVPSDLSPSHVACNVKRISIAASTFPRPEKEVFVSTTSETPSNGFATDFDLASANAGKFQPTRFIQDNESLSQDNPSRSEVSLVDFSRLLENRSDGSKGSDWMQSLKPTLSEENDETDHEEPIKKKIRNILPGGFAEQMLKLQRRENSEKVIWSHKIHRNKRKAQNESLCLLLKSITCTEEFIIAKASVSPHEESQSLSQKVVNKHSKATLHANDMHLSHLKVASENPLTSDVVFILFKRKAFTRLQLKVNNIFKVYQPWQTFHLKSNPHPFILCPYFIDVVSSSCPRIPNELATEGNIPVTGLREAPSLLKPSAPPETATHGDLLFFKRDELVTFSARIQRIWKKEFKVRNLNSSSAGTKYLRYSVLLQIREGTFHELRILPDTVPDSWRNVISQGEHKCFRFHNLNVTHRVDLKRDKYLRDILEALHLQNGGKLEQDFCYQLMFDSSSRCPEEITEIGFPGYCPVTVQPLLQVLKTTTCERVSCIAKILLQYEDVVYVSDESLLNAFSSKYAQVQFVTTAEVRSSLTGSVILIKEALVEEGTLLIDNYSQLIPSFETSHAYQQSSLESISKANIQTTVCLDKVISFLHMFSKVEDLVCIEGEIVSVDESAAVTWLQCSFCLQENLVQDTNLVIYCEDCSRIVPSPVLNVKLEVVVKCPHLPSAKVNIQLLSTTTKKILQIPEGTYQPQCSVCDVLGKEVGPLYCFVRCRDVTSDTPVFHLSEVCSN